MSATRPDSVNLSAIGWPWQLAVWGAMLLLAWWGFQGYFAEWPTDLALATIGWLLLGPIVWRMVTAKSARATTAPSSTTWPDWWAAIVIGGLAFGMSVAAAWPQWSFPPAYHDEYSYLFQAETLLAGRFSWPSPAVFPELFDQMHVLNEGRMASRYYPGTGAWIAPWLAAGVPYLGHWIAGALSAMLVYAIGRELTDRTMAVIAGVVFAVAPGPALFSNLLLAHHPTMLALLLFTWCFLRAMQRGETVCWWIAGFALAMAMLCRPATAAGFALPFGAWALWRLLRSPWESRRMVFGLGVPLLLGIGIALLYNHDVTGRWLTSPYQLYTEIYTPRHVFGLNNVTRGEQHLGPKVLESYDTWAENLTPSKAWLNVLNRLISTALFTVDMPLLLATILLTIVLGRSMSIGWKLVAAAIVSLHAIHWPFWYVGIFGWHYVFETAPLWCLLLAYVGRRLQLAWMADGRSWMPVWAGGFLLLAWIGMYVDAGEAWASRWKKSIGVMAYPRRQHAQFLADLERDVTQMPALVLVDGKHDGQQLDFVVNHAGLNAALLLGRFRSSETDWDAIASAFPDRDLYRYHIELHRAELVQRAGQ